MRDIALTALLLGSLPYAIRHPWFGTLVWAWVSVMSPHRLTFGFAHDLPWAAIVGGATLLGFLLTPDHRKLPPSGITTLLILLPIWMTVSTIFSLVPDDAWTMWNKVMKIFLMLLVTLMLLHTRKHIEWLVWITVGSIAFYGVKGGIFTLNMGGAERVWGPAGSFIEDNNALALAIVMIIPMLNYIRMTHWSRWVRYAMLPAMALCALSALGSHSRGGLLAIAAMAILLWWRGKRKFMGMIVIVTVGFTIVTFMPEKWNARMETIETYETDGSAMGRINAWSMALNLVKDRPVTGGGFDMYQPWVFAKWAPNPLDLHSAHSIYFQMLGEHGFPGLFFYLLLGALAWVTAGWIRARTASNGEYHWAYWMASMSQVSLVGFAVGGAFLNLAYFDAPYNLVVALVLTKALLQKELAKSPVKADGRRPVAARGMPANGLPDIKP